MTLLKIILLKINIQHEFETTKIAIIRSQNSNAKIFLIKNIFNNQNIYIRIFPYKNHILQLLFYSLGNNE